MARDVDAIWRHVRDHASGRTLGAIISKSELIDLSKGQAVIETDASVARLAEDRREAITSLVTQAMGEPTRVELRASAVPIGRGADGSENEPSPLASADEITARPIVRETLGVFDAKITRVTPRGPKQG
ncbi:MAG: hypothetical protein AAGK04_09825 [Planctomycetota bacterium]